MQRLFDIIFSGLAILILSPLLLVICLVLRITGEGKIFYLQERIGKYEKPIKILKFATMLKNSPNMGTGTVTIQNDPRILPLGKFLRKSKINELPQLFNIINGDMSIIGPRPQTRRCFEAFPESAKDAIISVRPGLSGIGSIFFRNEELMLKDSDNAGEYYDKVIMPYKGQLEQWYVKHYSIKIYFLLILATFSVLRTNKVPINWPLFSTLPDVPIELQRFISR